MPQTRSQTQPEDAQLEVLEVPDHIREYFAAELGRITEEYREELQLRDKLRETREDLRVELRDLAEDIHDLRLDFGSL